MSLSAVARAAMVPDSMAAANASIPSAAAAAKDFGKKRRTNRSAKLKQCKLDARREQWLSQGAVKNKGGKDEGVEVVAQRGTAGDCKNRRKNRLGNLETRGRGGEEEHENGSVGHHHDFDLDNTPSNSPSGSSVLGGNDSGTNFTGSTSSSSRSSSSSCAGCCSGNVTEEEEGEDNCLDDWEAMADAMENAGDDNKKEMQNGNPCLESESSSPEREPVVKLDNLTSNQQDVKQDCSRLVPRRLAPGNNRAWRPDDVFRPQSLPNLSKQRSFPNTDRHFGHGGLPWACASAANMPTSCPICCEDLDGTDSSFLPCACGFRLCLFCHKRILEEDGRCPGCRKPYAQDPVETEASLHGGSLTWRLARSCSMIARS